MLGLHLPASYSGMHGPYPVLCVLDGEQIFVPMVGLAQTLEWAFRAPGLIVVGIHNTNRTRDLTTPWTSAAPKGSYEPAAARAGGADRFLSVLQTELIPEIDRRYPTSHFRILFGHSFGGLFALHVFTQAPGLFTATIASSPPAFWNGDEEIHRLTLSTVFRSSFRRAKLARSRLDSRLTTRHQPRTHFAGTLSSIQPPSRLGPVWERPRKRSATSPRRGRHTNELSSSRRRPVMRESPRFEPVVIPWSRDSNEEPHDESLTPPLAGNRFRNPRRTLLTL